MVKVKASVFLLAVSIVVLLSVTLVSSGVTAQNSDDNHNDYWGSDGPIATIHAENATIGQWVELKEWCYSIFCIDTENFTLRIHVDGPRDVYNSRMQDPINWRMDYLTSVSYQASWQNNKEIQVYANTLDNQTKTFDFELTNIPYGNNTLQVSTSYVVSVFGPPYYTLNFSKGTSYFFVVAPTPTPTPTSAAGFSLEYATAVAAVGIAVGIIAVVFYKKRQKVGLSRIVN
jgi:hypothetical protein